MPRTRLSPCELIASRRAAGLDIRKFDGEIASVSIFMKNSTRRFSSGSTPSTSVTRLFSQLLVSRYDCFITSYIGWAPQSGSLNLLSPLAGCTTGSTVSPAMRRAVLCHRSR